MHPDEEAAAVNAARQVLAGAGHDLVPLTIAAALTAAATAHPDHAAVTPLEVAVIGPVGDGMRACTAMARAAHDVFAAAADTYLRCTGASTMLSSTSPAATALAT